MSVVFVVPKLPLNGRCGPGDQCLSNMAQCIRGLCRCNDNFYDRQGVCGMYVIATSTTTTTITSAATRLLLLVLLYYN